MGRTLWPDEFYAEYERGDLNNPSFPQVLDFESSAVRGGFTWYIGGPREVRVLDERVVRSWNERQRAAAPILDDLDEEAMDRARETGTFVDPETGQTWYSPQQLLLVFGGGGSVLGGVIYLLLRRRKTSEVTDA